MISQFENLNAEEVQLMYDAVPLVTILIAGADGNIDADETAWAKKLTDIRSYSYHESLREYYENVGAQFSDKLADYNNNLPADVAPRTEAITSKLSGLNDILPKLEQSFAFRYYESLTSFAKHVAKSSGGFLGFASISKEEANLMGLSMITPIEDIEEMS